MVVDERSYIIRAGKLNEYLALYEAEGLAIQRRFLGDPIGWYVTEIGQLNQVVHLWRYRDAQDRAERREALYADAGWLAFAAKAMPLIERMENRLLKPAPFFPLDGDRG